MMMLFQNGEQVGMGLLTLPTLPLLFWEKITPGLIVLPLWKF